MLSQTSTFNGDSLIARFSSLSAGATKNLCLINHSKRTVNVISAVGPQSLRQILVKRKNRATKTRFLLTCLGNLQVRNSILHDKQKKNTRKISQQYFLRKKCFWESLRIQFFCLTPITKFSHFLSFTFAKTRPTPSQYDLILVQGTPPSIYVPHKMLSAAELT